MRVILITIFLVSAIWCNAQNLSANQTRQVIALMKPQDDWATSQINWLTTMHRQDSIRINNLEKRMAIAEGLINSLTGRVKVLEDTLKNSIELKFDITTDFTAIKDSTGYLLRIKR